MDGIIDGTLDFKDDTSSMLAVLEKGGSKKILSQLLNLAKSNSINDDGLPGIFRGIASLGGPSEIKRIFEPSFHSSPASQAAAWAALINSESNKKPEGDIDLILQAALTQPVDSMRVQSLELIAKWKISELKNSISALAFNQTASDLTRLAAIRALGKLEGVDTKKLIHIVNNKESKILQLAGLESISRLNLSEAAKLGADMITKGNSDDELLYIFLNRESGSKALMKALGKSNLNKTSAAKILTKLQSIGCSDTNLMSYLSKVAEIKNTVPTYSMEYISDLAKASSKGNASNGKLIFSTAGCVACHQIESSNNNGIPFIGPDLETIGNTLSPERIIEEVIWPSRHVKEGYNLLQVTTNDGDVYQGYEQRTREKNVILRPLSQARTITIPQEEIREQSQLGSAMPTGLTSNLSMKHLADLIRYLSEKGQN